MSTQRSPNVSTDICLLLEGTWPYVRGGVSSWINQMILGMPEVTFSVLFIGGSRDAYPTRQYEIPDNVKHIEEIYLEDTWALNNDLPLHIKEPKNAEALEVFFINSYTHLTHQVMSWLNKCWMSWFRAKYPAT